MTPNRRLKQARELRGWSQAKVAEQIGTDATTVSRWERGLFSPTPYFRERLCTLFDRNAEELGLLESGQMSMREQSSIFMEPLTTISSSHMHEGSLGDDLRDEFADSMVAPSWPKRTDTFAYILHSAAHDQQAHMLWEDAYVRALRGQYVEAQRLGEASLNEFERVGHLNASAVREWLAQRELASTPPAVANTSALPPPMLSDQHKRPVRRIVRRRSTGIVLILLFALTVTVAGFSLDQFYPMAMASALFSHLASSANTSLQPAPAAGQSVTSRLVPQPVVTQAPATSSGPTAAPTSGITSTPTAGSTTASGTANAPGSGSTGETATPLVQPATLGPQNCVLEPQLGYRCTLTLQLYTSASGQFSWSVNSGALPATFNPSHGVDPIGTQVQVIVYVQSSQGMHGKFSFAFTTTQGTSKLSVTWLD